jgi:hypothetical protein
MHFWRVGDLIKRGIVTFAGEKGIVIVLCGALGVEGIVIGHTKTQQPHRETAIHVASLAEPPRSNYVVSAVASAVSLGDLGFTLSAVWLVSY